MRNLGLICLSFAISFNSFAQKGAPTDRQRENIITVIDQYAKAREEKDTVTLKKIITGDIDQLVSTGEWRYGIGSAVEGMLKSSASRPGTRTLIVNNIRLLNATDCIVDCKYSIQNDGDTARNMWSTFILVLVNEQWKITAIRNMLPVK